MRTEQITLSPDGRHLAYTARDHSELHVMIVEVDDPRKRVAVPLSGAGAADSPNLSFFRWAAPDCLVLGSMIHGREQLVSVNEQGANPVKLVLGDEFDEENPAHPGNVDSATRLLPRIPRALGFPSDKPGILMVEARGPDVGVMDLDGGAGARRTVTQLYEVDVRTGRKRMVYHDSFVGDLVYDQRFRPRLLHVQSAFSREQRIVLVSSSRWRSTESLGKIMDKKIAESFCWTPETYFGPRSIPLAFDEVGETLYFASNTGRDTFGLYAVNLGAKLPLVRLLENQAYDLVPATTVPGSGVGLVFDDFSRKLVGLRYTEMVSRTHWLDTELEGIQRSLEQKLPKRTVTILQWDVRRTRFLLQSKAVDDPGRYFIYELKDGRLIQFARSAPWLDLDEINRTEPFVFETGDGRRVSGYLTQPNNPLLTPPPLLVYLNDAPWTRASPDYDGQVQALARMGFLILQVNHRGTAGLGLLHSKAMRAGLDRVPLEDVRAAIKELGNRRAFDRRRIVFFGSGYGGFLALRALQLFPDEFRCAVGMDFPVDLKLSLFDHAEQQREGVQALAMAKKLADYLEQVSIPLDAENPRPHPEPPRSPPTPINFMREVRAAYFNGCPDLKELSLLRHPEQLTKPALLIQPEHSSDERLENSWKLRKEARARGVEVDVLRLDPAYRTGDPDARAQVFEQILGFLNATIYHYEVNIGTVENRK